MIRTTALASIVWGCGVAGSLAAASPLGGCAVPEVEVQRDGAAAAETGSDDATTEAGPSEVGVAEGAADAASLDGDAAADGAGDAPYCSGPNTDPPGGSCCSSGTPCYPANCNPHACDMCKCDAGTVCCTQGQQGTCKASCS